MATYQINYSCGHNEPRRLYGKEANRREYITWAEAHGRCKTCHAAAVEAIQAAEDSRLATAYGMADLTGTAKQVAWAGDIRRSKMADVEAWAEEMVARLPERAREGNIKQMDQLMCALAEQASASWWIDRRDAIGSEIAREIVVSLSQAKA